MADSSDVLGIPWPEGSDTFSAAAIQSLAERVDETPGVESLTSAEIAALASVQKPAGRVVWNSTTGKLQVSNGTSFSDLPYLQLAGGTMAGAIAMGSNKITGMTKGTASGDAVARQQIQSGTTSAISSGGSAAITFSPAFGSTPTVVATPMNNLGLNSRWVVNPVSPTGFTISQTNLDLANSAFMWIAVGD